MTPADLKIIAAMSAGAVLRDVYEAGYKWRGPRYERLLRTEAGMKPVSRSAIERLVDAGMVEQAQGSKQDFWGHDITYALTAVGAEAAAAVKRFDLPKYIATGAPKTAEQKDEAARKKWLRKLASGLQITRADGRGYKLTKHFDEYGDRFSDIYVAVSFSDFKACEGYVQKGPRVGIIDVYRINDAGRAFVDDLNKKGRKAA